MGLFRKRPAETATAPPAVAESLETLIKSSGQPSLFAHSDFVKQVTRTRCGAPKRLPSKTAYLYCDHCGSLIDYDFRLANSGTNAGLTNTVYHQLVAPVQGDLDRARAAGDAGRCRELLRGVFAEWIRQCPQAVSPRARADHDFRDRMVDYLAECTVRKDFEPSLAPLDQQMNAAISSLKRRPTAAGPWLVSDGIWEVAANAVVCESCGRKLDIAGGETPCQTCGAPLSFPVGASSLECPSCHSGAHRL